MSVFQTAIDAIQKAVSDAATLQVVSYKGQIQLDAGSDTPTSIDDVLAKAKTSGQFKLLAYTSVGADGDMTAYYDQDISDAEVTRHQALLETANERRKAVLELFRDAIAKAI